MAKDTEEAGRTAGEEASGAATKGAQPLLFEPPATTAKPARKARAKNASKKKGRGAK